MTMGKMATGSTHPQGCTRFLGCPRLQQRPAAKALPGWRTRCWEASGPRAFISHTETVPMRVSGQAYKTSAGGANGWQGLPSAI